MGDWSLSAFFASWFRQVLACWQWSNFVESQRDTARRLIYINMDETMVRLWQGGRRELVKLEPFAERKLFLDKEERGSLAEKRQNVSMVAFISDWPHAVWILGDLWRRLEPLGPLAQLALLLD